MGRDRTVADWMAGESEHLSELHRLLYEALMPDDPSDSEADSEAWEKACCIVEAEVLKMPATKQSVRRAELWRQEFGGGWDASWRMLLGPYRPMLPAGRAAELEAEAARTFERQFLTTWGIKPWSH